MNMSSRPTPEPVPLLALGRIGRSAGFARNPRYSAMVAAVPEPTPGPDPLIEAFERGYAEGTAVARAEADQRERERDAASERIELALAQMDQQAMAELRERLRQTVMELCEQAVMPLALDMDGLAHRVERATAMLQRAQDERRVLLNPADFALMQARLPAGLAAEPDPSVERGALRIETPDGGIEDGPRQWRRALAEAFREC